MLWLLINVRSTLSDHYIYIGLHLLYVLANKCSLILLSREVYLEVHLEGLKHCPIQRLADPSLNTSKPSLPTQASPARNPPPPPPSKALPTTAPYASAPHAPALSHAVTYPLDIDPTSCSQLSARHSALYRPPVADSYPSPRQPVSQVQRSCGRWQKWRGLRSGRL